MFCSDITSSLLPRRAANHALTFELYRLRTPGTIMYLIDTVLAMGDEGERRAIEMDRLMRRV
jgi:hypothetical protein